MRGEYRAVAVAELGRTSRCRGGDGLKGMKSLCGVPVPEIRYGMASPLTQNSVRITVSWEHSQLELRLKDPQRVTTDHFELKLSQSARREPRDVRRGPGTSPRDGIISAPCVIWQVTGVGETGLSRLRAGDLTVAMSGTYRLGQRSGLTIT